MLKQEGNKLVLKIKGLPRIEVKPSRELPPDATLKAIRITRKALRTEVGLSYKLPEPKRTGEMKNPVGIDMEYPSVLPQVMGKRLRSGR